MVVLRASFLSRERRANQNRQIAEEILSRSQYASTLETSEDDDEVRPCCAPLAPMVRTLLIDWVLRSQALDMHGRPVKPSGMMCMSMHMHICFLKLHSV